MDRLRLRILLAAALLAWPLMGGTARAAQESAWDFGFQALEGGDLPMQRFAGQPVLLVNTASMCGFAYQFEGLQETWAANRDAGLVVLGVPSGDFGDQEYGESGEIKQFCEVNFAVDFPMTEKEHVRGPEAHPLYQWLLARLGPSAEPKWNFHKILIGRDGQPVAAWPSRTEPDAPEVQAAIQAALAGSGEVRPGGS